MTQPCLEIVTYRVGATETADRERGAAREHAQKLPGFAGWLQLSGHEPEARADVVVWANREAADNAARAVGSGAQFAPFRATITEFGGVGHFPLPIGAMPFMQPGEGITLTRFRPRPGVSAEALRDAHARMIAAHLAQQPGWRGQRLAQLEGDIWCDIGFAASQSEAQAIATDRSQNAEAAAFLALTEPLQGEAGQLA